MAIKTRPEGPAEPGKGSGPKERARGPKVDPVGTPVRGLTLAEIGRSLFGRKWRSGLASILDVTPRTILNWENDGAELSIEHRQKVAAEIAHRQAQFEAVRKIWGL